MFLLRPFTFHYELIITTVVAHSIKLTSTFTFHYELIITEVPDNSTLYFLPFTFHYELIITGCQHLFRPLQYNLHFTMN